MIGELISPYRITRQIGAGGMGVVYLARDEQLERDLAIKVLAPGTLSDAEARRRFRCEAQLLAKLNHPFIEMVFDFGTVGDRDYIVLEYIPGNTVRDLLAGGPLAEDEVLRLGSMLAAGLEAAHEKGILHRDLKPGNLILTPEGRLKILDFWTCDCPTGDTRATSRRPRQSKEDCCRHVAVHASGTITRGSDRCSRRVVLGRSGAVRNGDGKTAVRLQPPIPPS
jgi:serine/threonine protein kinase